MINKNRILVEIVLVFLFFLVLFNFLMTYQNKMQREEYNKAINSIIYSVLNKYPDMSKKEIISILNGKYENINALDEYGIYVEDEFLILNQYKNYKTSLIINNLIILIMLCLLIAIYFCDKKTRKKRVERIIKTLEEINNKNYEIDVQNNVEDELSVLNNELYKTTIMLKEQADNSMEDKLKLKVLLEDISHQIKTPLTAISITLDNLTENPNLGKKEQLEFINDIKREISKINSLIINLLKLSKFDVNSINYNNQENLVKEIIVKAIENVSIISDLKNVSIKYNGQENIKLYCDFNWQVEAITNIIKNCVEHSRSGEEVVISYNQNELYTEIIISDTGTGISKSEIEHIFDRFYKGKTSNESSIGIGLSLAKAIIENNNGKIVVDSEENSYTSFRIRYFN